MNGKKVVAPVIHEHVDGFGHPARVHVACSRRQCKRQVRMGGAFTNRVYLTPTPRQAVGHGVSAS